MMKKFLYPIGFLVGIINACLGAGGGMLVVPTLKHNELSQKEAQATAIAVIVPLSIISAGIYIKNGYVAINDALPYLPFGVIGSIIGSFSLKKIPEKPLALIFACLLIYSGLRMVF